MTLPPATQLVELQSFQRHTAKELTNGVRLDGRADTSMRRIDVSREDVKDQPDCAILSSVTVRCGTAVVQCTVRGSFGPTASDTPNEGRVEVSVRMPFVPHSMAEGAPQQADVLSHIERFVEDVLLGSRCTDLAALCVRPGEACWVLSIVLTVLSSDGNLRGLCLHAAVASLQRIALPRLKLPDGSSSTPKEWPLRCTPLASSGAVCGGKFVVDPSAAEESVADGLITVVVGLFPQSPAAHILYIGHYGGAPASSTRALTQPLVACMQSFAQEHLLKALTGR